MSDTILILGACGQIGTELTQKLREIYGDKNVIASDIREGSPEMMESGIFEILDATDKKGILEVIQKYKVTEVYLMAAMLSATAEKHPQKGWDLNMTSLLGVLELAKEKYLKKVYWPSSMAVFGVTSPKINTPQQTIMEPSTVYGISKVAGEHWCNYYHEKYGVDVRSIRYPGIISWKTLPGGGTTDYAVDIYFEALRKGTYECFLSKDTRLPMMYMDDAINATIKIMQADKNDIKLRTSYNLSAISFTPEEIAREIQAYVPNFNITYAPDFRQAIADSWPQVIDDSSAREDWGWSHQFDLPLMTKDIITNLRAKKENTLTEL
ncbi:NAD-dependent epimerase/dehydratase family protein [Tenacibaculum maritimum]|uniref:NAD-dependent epimerase/dehydratase family protein n=1 Tax=Tenacibaculum maritimum TaxID=107401 RepID=UPI0010A40542|nr:NAD-dependent epimerase/dehydratase family protein [Tenacibaculum maritimum]MCD9580865.1 NAD-dependent epimerase/dehydratase family protein [Tenacibaculum maritimum]MCD9584022.1 NAD-dependent epimerase/dehydratase family protein [Tenacibaculum maritimum]MCD9610356.1 NAD-dependent epimerase/dehydratase family protein [Tenacibaculum maritimum]MCD9620038.1 NAD-dependent epimerase/dehydratase family protein [Tenacibaculum maritimum]MCD9626392.1 NAD-dependent epimerase/dehydratase family protein